MLYQIPTLALGNRLCGILIAGNLAAKRASAAHRRPSRRTMTARSAGCNSRRNRNPWQPRRIHRASSAAAATEAPGKAFIASLPGSPWAGLRGFELAYAGIDPIVLRQSGREDSVHRTLSNGPRGLCFQAHLEHSQGQSGLDFVPERSIGIAHCPALIGAAPEPR